MRQRTIGIFLLDRLFKNFEADSQYERSGSLWQRWGYHCELEGCIASWLALHQAAQFTQQASDLLARGEDMDLQAGLAIGCC